MKNQNSGKKEKKELTEAQKLSKVLRAEEKAIKVNLYGMLFYDRRTVKQENPNFTPTQVINRVKHRLGVIFPKVEMPELPSDKRKAGTMKRVVRAANGRRNLLNVEIKSRIDEILDELRGAVGY